MNDSWKTTALRGQQQLQNEIELREQTAQHWETVKSEWNGVYRDVGRNLAGYFKARDNKPNSKNVEVCTREEFYGSDLVKFYTVVFSSQQPAFYARLLLRLDMIDGYKKCSIGYWYRNNDKAGLFGKRYSDFDYWGKKDGYKTIELPVWSMLQIGDLLTSELISFIEHYELQ